MGIDIEIVESTLGDQLCKHSMEIEIAPGNMVSKNYNMTISKDEYDDEDEYDEYSDLKCHVCIMDPKNKKIRKDLDLMILPDNGKEIQTNSNGIAHIDSNICPELSNDSINKTTLSVEFLVMAVTNDEVPEYVINCTLKYNSKMHGLCTKTSNW